MELKNLEKILKLGSDYKVDKQEEKNEIKKQLKLYMQVVKRKKKCPECGKYTNSIQDKLKPIELKYLKITKRSKISLFPKNITF